MNIELIDNIMVTLRQDKPCKEGLRRILPQRIEGGRMYSSLGVFITTVPDDIEAVEFYDADEVLEAQRVTDALLNRLYTPINEFLREYKKAKLDTVEDEPLLTPSQIEEQESDESLFDELTDDIEELLEKGKVKKAKKLLKKNKDILTEDEYKTLKKLIKQGESDG